MSEVISEKCLKNKRLQPTCFHLLICFIHKYFFLKLLSLVVTEVVPAACNYLKFLSALFWPIFFIVPKCVMRTLGVLVSDWSEG